MCGNGCSYDKNSFDPRFMSHSPGFDVSINGKRVIRDNTKIPLDTASGDRRIVLGRAYSTVDDHYTSMEVDQVMFCNKVKPIIIKVYNFN